MRRMWRVSENVERFAHACEDRGWAVFVVGGWVRDRLLGVESKDVDLEVLGPQSRDELHLFCLQFDASAKVTHGRFPVVKMRLGDEDLDVALPRTEICTGDSHQSFDWALTDDTRTAAARRDFTINSASWRVVTGELIDHFGAERDLQAGVLSATSEQFCEDATRVLRGVQQSDRFGLMADERTAEMCRGLSVGQVESEMVWIEFEKWARRGQTLRRGMEFLVRVWSQFFTEVADMQGVEQDWGWHPEGWSFKVGLPFDLGLTSSAQPVGVDGGACLWEIFSPSLTKTAMIPGFSCAPGTESVMNGMVDSLSATNQTRANSLLSTSERCVAVSTETESFVWSFSPAIPTDKIVRVMFKVPVSRVISIMNSSVDDLQVFRRIVHPVAVYMMDMLPPFKLAVKNKLHNISMKTKARPEIGDIDVLISSVVMELESVTVDNNVFFYFDFAFKSNIHIDASWQKFTHDTTDRLFCQIGIGDVFEHTMQSLEWVATQELRDPAVVFAVLCHDMGKALTTAFVDGKVRSRGHDVAGVEVARRFMGRVGAPQKLVDQVVVLVRMHMRRVDTSRGVRRLARDLAKVGATVEQWVQVVSADQMGRGERSEVQASTTWVAERASEMKCERGGPEPLVKGRHVVVLVDRKPGPWVGEVLAAAFEAQLDGVFSTTEQGVEWVKEQGLV